MKLDKSKPYGVVCGDYEECPGARYEQGGNFFNEEGSQLGVDPANGEDVSRPDVGSADADSGADPANDGGPAPENGEDEPKPEGAAKVEVIGAAGSEADDAGAAGDSEGSEGSEDDDLRNAVLEVMAKGDSTSVTQDGEPKVAAVKKVLGKSVSKDDIKRIYDELS